MSEFSPGGTFDAVSRQVRAERSVASKRAIIKSQPADWFLDHVDGIVASSEKVLRQGLINACAAHPDRLSEVVQVLGQRLALPAANRGVAEALYDIAISLLAAPRLAKPLRQQLSLVERARLFTAACLAAVDHSLSQHPKLKTVLKDSNIGQVAFSEVGVSADVRRLLLKAAPGRAGYGDLIVSGLRRDDPEMLRLLTSPGLPVDPTEAAEIMPRAARAFIAASGVPPVERAARLAALMTRAGPALDATTRTALVTELYARAGSRVERAGVAEALLAVLDETAREGLGEIQRALARYRVVGSGDFVALAGLDLTQAEEVAWLLRAAEIAREASELPTDEIAALGRAALEVSLGCSEVFGFIARQLPRGSRFDTWVGAALDYASSRMAREIPPSKVAVVLGDAVAASDDRRVRQRLFDLFLESHFQAREFWAEVLSTAGLQSAWHAIVGAHAAESQADAEAQASEESRKVFTQGYTRATVIFQEKLKLLARAAARLMEDVAEAGAAPALRPVLNDVLTILASLAITPVGEIGSSVEFDPALHEDTTGTLAPGDQALVSGIGFVLDSPDGSKEFVRKISIRPKAGGER